MIITITITILLLGVAVAEIKNFVEINCCSILKGYCDTITDGGGWLVIQRTQDGSINFNKFWVDYEDGLVW